MKTVVDKKKCEYFFVPNSVIFRYYFCDISELCSGKWFSSNFTFIYYEIRSFLAILYKASTLFESFKRQREIVQL